MASKTQKQIDNISEKIVEAYIDYVLTEQKDPASVYAFSKQLKMSEADFYKHFNSFSDLEKSIWTNAINNTVNSLKASEEYATYNSREKVLGFFYTLIEVLNAKRSYFIYSLGSIKSPFKTPDGIKTPVLEFAKEVIHEGLAGKELEDRKFISERYPDAVWMNFMFILNFWADDDSKGFEKTDAAIEKSVNLMIELMGKSALDSMLDLGKFLFQNGMKLPFRK